MGLRARSSLLRTATKADPGKALQDALSAASRQSSQVSSNINRPEGSQKTARHVQAKETPGLLPARAGRLPRCRLACPRLPP